MEKITKTSEALRRDYDAYEEVMYRKALREGMDSVKARSFAQEQAKRQMELRQKELEEAESRRQGVKR